MTVPSPGGPGTEPLPALREQMMQLLGGFQVSQAAYAVAKLGLATALLDRPRSIMDLSQVTGTTPSALRRLVRTLTPLGVFRATGEDELEITQFGAMLAEGYPGSVHGLALFWMEMHYLPFSELTHAVKMGWPTGTRHLGMPLSDWIADDPHRAAVQDAAFGSATSFLRAGLFDGYELPEPGKTVAHIGGTDGSLLAELLRADPARTGIVFDLPHVVTSALPVLASRGLSDRVRVMTGDLFTSAPAADVYLLSFMLHDWDDSPCLRILRSMARASLPGARLVVIEAVLPDHSEPHLSKVSDLIRLAMLDGARERTGAEYEALLGKAGFTLDRIVPTPTPFSIIEATRG